MNNQLTAQAENQHVVGTIAEWSTLFGAGKASPTFSKDTGLVSPEDQEIGHRDRCIVVHVKTHGPGNVSRGAINPCTVNPGDYVLVNLYHKAHQFTLLGNSLVTFNWEQVMARLAVDEVNVDIQMEPLQAYLICEKDLDAAKRFMQGESPIIRPYGDAQECAAPGIDERGQKVNAPKVAIERVVSVGPGGIVDGAPLVPTQVPGDHILYDTSVSPVQFRVQGKAYTIVHHRHVILTLRGASNSIEHGRQEPSTIIH